MDQQNLYPQPPQPHGPAHAHHPAQEPPQPAPAPAQPIPSDPTRPTPVVKVLSPLGVEYVFLTFCLFAGAIALTVLLVSLVNGIFDFSTLAFPSAVLVVTLPLFAALFLRIKKLELRNPALRLDASKRRSTQFTQIFSFIVVLLSLIVFVSSVFSKLGGEESLSIGKIALDVLCVFVVFGGMLSYYWYDEHKVRR